MVRVLKDPAERKAEIMDAAWELFNKKGYDQTSVNEILLKAGIAKGTFYYYFKSKEEILNSVLERWLNEQIEALQHVVVDQNINAVEKIKRILITDKKMHMENGEVLYYLHKSENIIMHQKSLVLTIKKVSPIFSGIIQEGIQEKLFRTNYPLEVMEIILTGISFLMDQSIFSWNEKEYIGRIRAIEDLIEATLRAEKGCFGFLVDIAEEMFQMRLK
jgi:AcrR family transcriptional regulator